MHHRRFPLVRRWLFACLATLCLIPAAAVAADSAGVFQVIIGEVRVVGAGGQERTAVKGENILEGDRVVTGEGALAQVKFADGGLMSIRANTEFVLDKFSYAGPQDAKPSILMSLVKGGLRSITGLIGQKNRDGYRISTTTATIGIRGTDHEPMVILPPPPGAKAVDLPGTYDKVNDGSTILRTPKGVVEILPRQVGFVPSADVAPRVLLKIPEFFRNDPPKQGAANREDRSADGNTDQKGPAARVLAPGGGGGGRVLSPEIRALGERLGTTDAPALRDALRDSNISAPAVRTLINQDSAIVSPTNVLAPAGAVINVDNSVLAPAVIAPAASSTLISPTTSIAPATSTLVAPATIISPTTSTLIAPTTTMAPATSTLIAPSTVIAPTTSTFIAPTTTIAPTTSTLIAPTTTIAPTTSTLIAPSTTTTSPALKTLSPAIIAPIIKK